MKCTIYTYMLPSTKIKENINKLKTFFGEQNFLSATSSSERKIPEVFTDWKYFQGIQKCMTSSVKSFDQIISDEISLVDVNIED